MNSTRSYSIFFSLVTAAIAQTPQFQVIPTAYSTNDAISYEWVAGASRDLRQQILIGSSHTQQLQGHLLDALEFRRTAAAETYQGGQTLWTVTMSIAPHTPIECSRTFQQNVGPNPVQVFQGTVTIPTSPPTSATPGTAVPWSAQNVIRVPFSTPFPYTGGTLVVDIIGQPIAGQTTEWWMADAMFEDLLGTAANHGAGCGLYGGPNHEWAHAAERTLLPGAHARFWAYGTPLGFAIVAYGAASAQPIPLAALGVPAPGCAMHLDPALVLATEVSLFVPEPHPLLAAYGGIAESRLKLPGDPWTYGLTLTTQWLDLSQPATSNAVRWTVASTTPGLDMALVEGSPLEPHGEATVHLAQVLRFEYR